MYEIAAVFIGVLIAIMATFNAILHNYSGSYLSILIIHIVGLITVIFALIIKKQKIFSKKKAPMYLYGAGAIGVLMVLFSNICFAQLGASLTLSLTVFGELVMSCIIDHFGLLGMKTYKFYNKKIIGFIIIFAGIVVMAMY
ncbi:MAG: DMT family transporter [Clostridium argentinense]|uniref:DMT family transporter n=1 Tax=Clostridium faecium TaxID=2762223 RepID=A0ABR8YQH5_9CLOT|nr:MULTISPECIES: DMT family transporter [Clostridium]MBD8046517.1 DMT family transporter [Clostridium faecium]MBS5823010.1 DMT family transporter [Clostridium argentinense]